MTSRALLVLALASASGCVTLREPTPDPVPVVPFHRGPDLGAFARVVLPPFGVDSSAAWLRPTLERELRAAVARRNLFDVVTADESAVADARLASVREAGVFRTEDLIAMGRRFGVDGILVGSIADVDAYPVMQCRIGLTLIDVRTGEVAWSSDAHLDASDRNVAQDVHNYYDTHLRGTDSLVRHEMVLTSPQAFARYTASRLVATLERALYPERRPAGRTRRSD